MQEIRQLLSQGLTVRQVAGQTGYSRKQVEEVAEAMKQQRKSSASKGIAIIVALAVGAIALFLLIAQHKQSVAKANDPATWRPAIMDAISGLRRTFAPDKWLLEEDNASV